MPVTTFDAADHKHEFKPKSRAFGADAARRCATLSSLSLTTSIETILENALKQPKDAIRYVLSQELAKHFPGRGLVETDDCSFYLRDFAREGLCSMNVSSAPHAQSTFDWYGEHSSEDLINAWAEVKWDGHAFQVVYLSLKGMHSDEKRTYIVGPTKDSAIEFFETVCAWNEEVRGEVLVYHGSGWYKSVELYESIRNSSYDDLILARSMLDDIRHDFDRFLARKEIYEKHRIPWKRGILFLGPPGNGKTQMVKALANSLGIPVLYVRSLRSGCGTEHDSIRRVFNRARQAAPCLLVLEDLDSLIHAGNRSFFLNEMDGFSANTGIITLATANYPERLDPAILDRPSRFDRKYHFELPGVLERARYIAKWNASLEKDLQLSEEGIEKLAKSTDEFSFAYIKELFLSGMMQWIDESGARSMDEVLLSLAEPLRAQMKSSLNATPVKQPKEDEDEDDFDGEPVETRMQMR